MEDLRYPIGKNTIKPSLTEEERKILVQQIADAPKLVRSAVKGLSDEQLDTPYRPGGWSVRQVVHHLPDSHMNAYIRFKLGMTETQPTIKPYNEKEWSELAEAKSAPVAMSLQLLESLHERWVLFLRSMKASDFARTIVHPESGVMNLDRVLQIYSWHGRHHTAHITSLRERMGWK